MGISIYKADFLYPHHPPPIWMSNIDEEFAVNPSDQQGSIAQLPLAQKQPVPIEPAPRYLPFKSNYDDYSECSEMMASSQLNPSEQVETKVVFLPSKFHGPILMRFKKYFMREEENAAMEIDSVQKLKSFLSNSRSSSGFSLNSSRKRSKIRLLTHDFLANQKKSPQNSHLSENIYTHKSKEEWKKGNYQDCIKYLLEGITVSEAQHPQHYSERSMYNQRIGIAYWKMEKPQQALKYYNEALNLLDKQSEEKDLQKSGIYNNIGIIYQQQKQLDKAIEYFQRSLEIKRQYMPENHSQIATSLGNIALLQWNKGELQKSVENYGQALHINKIVYGYNHPEVARNFYNLSLCLFDIKQYSLWLDYHCQSLNIMKNLGMSHHPDYSFRLKWFKIKIKQLMMISNFHKELVLKSIGLMNTLLDEDQQIQFLLEVKTSLEKMG